MEEKTLLKRLCSRLGIGGAEEEECKAILAERSIRGALSKGLLSKEEVPFARDLINRHNLATFSAFLAYRQKTQPFRGSSFSPEPDEIQAKLNRQFGITDEVFKKFGAEP